MTDSKIIFGEFIRYAYGEVHTPNWGERVRNLCGDLINYQVTPMNEELMNKTFQEVMEDHNGDFELVLNIIFTEMMSTYPWFVVWFWENFPEREWDWSMRNEFTTFLYSLGYEDLIEIIDTDLCLK